MPYTGNPSTSLTDQVRLIVGDRYDDIEMLSDVEYQYYLDKYEGSVQRAALDAARSILAGLARLTRERTGGIEVYGSEWFKNYRNFLLDITKNPDLMIISVAPYAGGISKSDMAVNDADPDNVCPLAWIGEQDGVRVYDD